jgi:glycosyltransferase involved in cell wall biosynthesis
MKILQISNLISHLQLPIADKFAEKIGGDNFRFVSLCPPDKERMNLGWSQDEDRPWILRAGESNIDMLEFENWWDNADVVICGERRIDRMSDRLKSNKLCFYTSERWWKPPIGIARMLHPKFANMAYNFNRISNNPLFHYLAKGPFASSDIKLITNMRDRVWSWGYFSNPRNINSSQKMSDGILKILWIGRMLSWKQVDTLIRAAAELATKKIKFKLTIVGDGEKKNELMRLASSILHKDCYLFRESISSSKVVELMSQNDVYVLPSNAYEGWGFVINEAMESCCAVVASSKAGAPAAMIKDGVNGLLFNPSNHKELALKLENLASDVELLNNIANEGKKTITKYWSADVAADRFLEVADALLSKKQVPTYSYGPLFKYN